MCQTLGSWLHLISSFTSVTLDQNISKITDQSKKVVKISYHSKFSKPEVVQRVGLGSIGVSSAANNALTLSDKVPGPRTLSSWPKTVQHPGNGPKT